MCSFPSSHDSLTYAQLPLEVIQLIILYMPFTRLQFLCEQDGSLKCLIAPILYRYVSIHEYSDHEHINHTSTKFHDITLRELKQLVSGDISARIQHFKIYDWWANDKYSQEIWRIIRDSSEFFLNIPTIDYDGDHYDMCMELLPMQNLRHLSILSDLRKLQINAFPPNITALTLDVNIADIPRFPKAVKHLRLGYKIRKNLVFEFPPYLKLLSIMKGTITYNQPEGFHLMAPVYDLTLPDSLMELEVDTVHPLFNFPSGLKVLKIITIKTLVGMKFPSNLEVLNFYCIGDTSLDNIVFPSLLRELRLRENKLESLDNVLFPNLLLLDLTSSNGNLRSLSPVQFPRLECLMAYGQPVQDWSNTSLPETLRKLEISVMEEPQTLRFPPNLRLLEIYFRDDLTEYSALQLPDTLEELYLDGGVSSIFEWNLPHLRSLKIIKFAGPIKAPESVVDLSLQYENSTHIEEILLPPNVERLELPYPLEEYPPTVTDLRIHPRNMKSFPHLPKIENVGIYSRRRTSLMFLMRG